MPDDMFAYAEAAAGRRPGRPSSPGRRAAHLPGMLAAKTTVPVLGVPVASRHLRGVDSLHSIVQMPKGIPVATFAIGTAGAANAALFAVAMLANDRPVLRQRLDALPRRADPNWPAHDLDLPQRWPLLAFVARRHAGVMGGQLGRMFVHAGAGHGLFHRRARPRPDSPCRPGERTTTSSTGYEDEGPAGDDATSARHQHHRVRERAPPAAGRLAGHRAVAPAGTRAVSVARTGRAEGHFRAAACPAPHAVIEPRRSWPSIADLLPGILKTGPHGLRRQGPGARVQDRAELAAAWAALKGVPCVLERCCPCSRMSAVIVGARRRRPDRAPARAAQPCTATASWP